MHALDPKRSVMKHSVTQSHTEPSLCSAQRRLWWRGRGDCKPSFCLPQLHVGWRPTQPSAQIRAAIKTFYFTPVGLDPWGAHHSDIRAWLNFRPFPSNLCQAPSLLKGASFMLSGISPSAFEAYQENWQCWPQRAKMTLSHRRCPLKL